VTIDGSPYAISMLPLHDKFVIRLTIQEFCVNVYTLLFDHSSNSRGEAGA
jgi:hypothetical protein